MKATTPCIKQMACLLVKYKYMTGNRQPVTKHQPHQTTSNPAQSVPPIQSVICASRVNSLANYFFLHIFAYILEDTNKITMFQTSKS